MFFNRYYVTLGCKRKRRDELTEDLGTLLTELNAQTMTHLDEHQRKFMLLEAELEEKRRRQEQQHEQRMMEMMMTFIRQVANPSTTPTFVPPGPQLLQLLHLLYDTPHITIHRTIFLHHHQVMLTLAIHHPHTHQNIIVIIMKRISHPI